MTVKSLGSLPVGSISLGTAAVLPVVTGYSASLNAKLANVTMVLSLSAGITPVDPVKYGEMLVAQAKAWVEQIPDMLTKLPAASVTVKADLLKQETEITAQIALIGATLGKLQAALSTGGVEAYAFEGRAGDIGAELSRFVTGAGQANALVLVARDPAAWAALSTVLYTG